MRPVRLTFCRIAALLLVASGASAAEPAPERLETMDVRGLVTGQLRLAPGAASLFTEEDLRQLRPYSLHDALDFVPGVRTIDDDALGLRAGIGVRGAPPRRSRKTLLLEDGTPINASAYLDSSAHYTPPMERLDRVEVLRANGQIVHGPLNNHGIVNFRNVRATEVPVTAVELAGGTRGTLRRHLMHRRTLGDTGVVLAYTGMDADGIFDVERHRFNDLYASLEHRLSPAHALEGSLTMYRERSRYDESNLTPQEYALAPDVKRGRFGQEHNTIAVDYLKLDAVHRYERGGRLSVSSRVFATDLDRPRFTVDPGDVDAAALPRLEFVEGAAGAFEPGSAGVMVSRDRRYRTLGLETRVEHGSLRSGAVEHRLQWGLRHERHGFRYRRDRGEPGEVLDVNRGGTLVRDREYAARAVSGFVMNEMRFEDWTLTPGVRAEYFTQRKQRLVPELRPRESDHRSVLLPGISLRYSGLTATDLFASVQRGYSPAIARTATGFPLLPETGVNWQVGARSTAVQGLSFEAAAFLNRLRNTLVRQVTSIDGQNVTVNAGNSQTLGLDVSLSVESSAWSDSPYNAFARLAANVSRARFTSGEHDGNTVPEIPLLAGSATAGVEHRSGWQLSATLSHMGAFYTDEANTGPVTLLGAESISIREPEVVGRVPSHTLLSARASMDLDAAPVTVWVQGRNLTGRRYLSDVENGLRPGAGRTLMAGFSARF